MAKIHKCQTCEKEFNRSSSLKRHERTVHGITQRVYACHVCGANFKRPDNFQRHCKIHSIREDKSSEEVRKNESTDTSKEPRETRPTKRRASNDNSDTLSKRANKSTVGLDDLPQNLVERLAQDEELLQFYRTHWRQIRSSVKKGKILTKYNCYLPTLNTDTFLQCLKEVFEQQKNAFKINVAFGFILRNNETNQRKFYYSSGNTRLFNGPHLITDRPSFEEFSSILKQQDPLEHAKIMRPNR